MLANFVVDIILFNNILSSLVKKYIKLSIQFIKNSHENLIQDLKSFIDNSSQYGIEVDRIIRNSILMYNFDQAIQYFSGQSDQFCKNFYEEDSENSIQVILDHLYDHRMLTILIKNMHLSLLIIFFFDKIIAMDIKIDRQFLKLMTNIAETFL